MSRFWSQAVHGLTPYVPGEQPRIAGLIKLNTNECPYAPSLRVLQAIRDAAGEDLRLYPDPQATQLREAIAAHHGLKPDQVFVGNGSDEVLAHAFMALFRQDKPLLMPDIGYSFYPVYAQLYGIRTRSVPLDAQLRLRVQDLLDAGANGGMVLANPNAPTGIALPLEDIERLLRGNPDSAVLVDEAYVDFGAQSAAELVDRHPQLLVVRTLSKARALAGLRVGYALGQAELIEGLVRVKDSFNSYPLDRLALAGAVAAMQDDTWFAHTRSRIVASREQLSEQLRELGFEVLPSSANFVFARHARHDAAGLAAALREQRILVRHFRRPERIAQFLRISIGTEAQCEALVQALRGIVQAGPSGLGE
ncbi:MAG: histidinol-phosphate transaminase [Betaproteobacteria bacterium]|nr:histidinol-phosphate transaminase [Betaproteobacteria bacterium]MBU6512242.1 histidinol-phosphate transaminase [Betaproteobacteria bacterium]MDE1955814.1 histidinol-phosphate transaminase [Betaproteobacteria bacterium]MDE2152470.1 histidinol-phosphate transaminase [Betaproteobacteria bacterium]MDE2480034.1 histidinol-phosphate transaminase [Betaproteobacteria bacterium]